MRVDSIKNGWHSFLLVDCVWIYSYCGVITESLKLGICHLIFLLFDLFLIFDPSKIQFRSSYRGLLSRFLISGIISCWMNITSIKGLIWVYPQFPAFDFLCLYHLFFRATEPPFPYTFSFRKIRCNFLKLNFASYEWLTAIDFQIEETADVFVKLLKLHLMPTFPDIFVLVCSMTVRVLKKKVSLCSFIYTILKDFFFAGYSLLLGFVRSKHEL